jgi:hypothetical protein
MADITSFNAVKSAVADYEEMGTRTITTYFIMLHRLHG